MLHRFSLTLEPVVLFDEIWEVEFFNVLGTSPTLIMLEGKLSDFQDVWFLVQGGESNRQMQMPGKLVRFLNLG